MKKKGLIVATIVMVLVLAVSLSTATYAWFTEITETTIKEIPFSVGAGSEVIIGIKEVGTYDPNATEKDFWSNDTTFDGTKWAGSTNGFGASINTGLDLGTITKAVGTGKLDATEGNTVNAGWNVANGNVVLKANGASTVVDAKSAEAAVANGYEPDEGDKVKGDYLDVVIGVKPSKTGLKSITLNLTVNPNAGNTVIGMNAAIHAIYEIDTVAQTSYTAGAYTTGDKSGEIDIYGDVHYGKKVTEISQKSSFAQQNLSNSTGDLNAGWKNVAIQIATTADEAGLSVDTFYQVHLIVFIAGYDADCNQSAMGVGANIFLNFTAEAVEA